MKASVVRTTIGTILRVRLKEGESFYAEPGALISVQGEVEVKSELSGGLTTSVLRALGGGESVFINRITALMDSTLELGTVMPSEIFEVDLDGGLILGDGVYLAHSGDIQISTRFGGLTSLMAGSGLMFLHAEGKGKLYLSATESLHVRDVKRGETFYLDNSCFVAIPDDVELERVVMGKGLLSKVASGEGIMFRIRGPAKVYYQSESPSALAKYLSRFLSH